jgi:hypothetical protein
MKRVTLRGAANIVIGVVGMLLYVTAYAKNEVVVDGKAWEEVGRMEAQPGEIILRLKLKPVTAPPIAALGAVTPQPAAVPDIAPDAKNVLEKAKTSPEEMDAKTEAVALFPALDKDFSAVLAKEVQPTDSPGLTALGVTAGDFNEPVTPKDFAAFVAKGTDASGKLKEGVAVQISPANVFFPKVLIGGRTYENTPWMQAVARTSLELATAKSDDARIGQQVAAAVTVGLIDGADPRLFWAPLDNCALKAMQPVALPPKPEQMMSAPELKAWQDSQNKAVAEAKDCYASYLDGQSKIAALWAKPRWYVGYAKAWYTGESDKIRDSKAGPSMFWTSFSYGLNKAKSGTRTLFQLAASRKLGLNVKDPADETKLVNEDRSDIIMRLRFSHDRWSAFVDAGVAKVKTAGALSENVRRYGYGAEFKLTDTLWLVLGSITERGFASGEKRTLLNTGLRFGQSSKPVFGSLDDAPKK